MIKSKSVLEIHTDGGARGNPGPAAAGAVIEKKSQDTKNIMLKEISCRIGETTNNVAEYTAIIKALEWLKENQWQDIYIIFYLDSNLLVNQLNGIYKVKNPNLRELLMRVRMLESEIKASTKYIFIRREMNTHADLLVNQALDGDRV